MRTMKSYRMPDYAIESMKRQQKKMENEISDADFIANAITFMETIQTEWNDLYKDRTSDVTELFDITDCKQMLEVGRVLRKNLGNKDH